MEKYEALDLPQETNELLNNGPQKWLQEMDSEGEFKPLSKLS